MNRVLASATLLAGLAAALPLGAEAPQNLLVNGEFRTSLASWSRIEGVSFTASGAASPGAARVSVEGRPDGVEALVQCVAVEGLRLYDLSAAAVLPASPGASGGLSVRLQFHAAAGCQGPTLRGAPSLDFATRPLSGWQVKELRRIPAPEAAVSALVVVVARAAGRDPYSTIVDDLVLRRSVENDDVFLPTAASIRGANGERFETDVWVHNPVPAERTLELRLWRGGRPTLPVAIRVGAGTTRHLADVVGSVLGETDTAGALQLSFDPRGGPMLFTASVVTVNPESPGNGSRIPVATRDEARTSALFPALGGVRGDAAGSARVNAGAFNPHAASVELSFWLYDREGGELGTFSRTLGPGAWLQVNDVMREVGAPGADEGTSLVVRSRLPVFPFAVVVDGRSGDGTFVAPRDVPLLP